MPLYDTFPDVTRQSHDLAPASGAAGAAIGRVIWAALLLLAPGCRSATGPAALSRALADYEAGHYLLARERAGRVEEFALHPEPEPLAIDLQEHRLPRVVEPRVELPPFDLPEAAGRWEPLRVGPCFANA